MLELKVTGMTCGHCEKAVTDALAAVAGVERVVKVDREAQRATVEGTPDPQALIRAIEEEGYDAQVA